MAKLTPSVKDHDKLDKIKLQEEIDSANNTLSSNKNVEGDNDDNIIGENQTEDVLSPNDINIGSSYSKSVRRSSHKFGSRLRFFRRTSAAVQGANLEDEELQASQKKQESTEITDSDNDDESRSSIVRGRNVIGSLLKDTYSFIYVYPVCSAPTIYAAFLFIFQSLVYALLLSSLIDINNPNNILHVPPSVSIEMRIAQGCAILIAVVNSVDIMVAMNNLLRVPTAIIVIDNNGDDESQGLINTHGPSIHNATELSSIQHGIGHARSNISGTIQTQSFKAGFKFKIANMMRLVEGILSVASSFILIVRSNGIIELFINFAALEFVVNLDNLAFALAEHGLISDRLQVAAIFVGGLGYTYPCHRSNDNNRRTRNRSREGCSPSQLAHIKGSFIVRLFSSPARYVKNHPDYTRRTTLFIMAATLYGCWFVILAGLNNGQFLCKSLNIDFFHAHISVNTREQCGARY